MAVAQVFQRGDGVGDVPLIDRHLNVDDRLTAERDGCAAYVLDRRRERGQGLDDVGFLVRVLA
jgi:hypothetical protein